MKPTLSRRRYRTLIPSNAFISQFSPSSVERNSPTAVAANSEPSRSSSTSTTVPPYGPSVGFISMLCASDASDVASTRRMASAMRRGESRVAR
jgi:hypothetical protein